MYTIVVTGITGKSGKAFLNKLIEHSNEMLDYHFLFICREHSFRELYGQIKNKLLSAEIITADLNLPTSLEKVFLRHVDMVFHIAGIYTTFNITQMAAKHGVQDFILVHTTGIYSKYKSARREYENIETAVTSLLIGKNVTILRPTMIYGDLKDKNISTFIKMVDKLPVVPMISGGQIELQPVWANDLGKAYYQVLISWKITKNKEYVLSGKQPLEIIELFREISKQLNKKFRYVSIPYPIAYGGAVLLYAFTFRHIDYREKVQRMVESRAYSHDNATKDFNYNPVSFNVGISEEIKLYLRTKLNG